MAFDHFGFILFKIEDTTPSDPTPNPIVKLFPNWNYIVSLKYTFNTVISVKRKKGEQRKTLYNLPIRLQRFTATETENEALIWHYLIQQHASNFKLPIFSEPCKCEGTGSIQGDTIIQIINNLSGYYNLRELTTQVILIDLTNTLDNEIKTLRKVHTGAKAVEFTTSVVGNFLSQSTVIFPLYNCYILNKSRTDMSDRASKFDLEFMEYK